MESIKTEKQLAGKFKNKVQLSTLIMEAQDKELDKLCEKTGRSKASIIGEAIQLCINEYHKMGVI
jgi:predicted DNA-binding protein